MSCSRTEQKSNVANIESITVSYIRDNRARGYKTFFMLNSAETKIYPAHKC